MKLKRRDFLESALKGLGAVAVSVPLAQGVQQAVAEEMQQVSRAAGADLWALVRRSAMLAPGLVHLNTGSLGACTRTVFQITQEAWRHLERNPVAIGFGEAITLADAARVRAAAFLGARPEEVAFTNNTTEGMNAIAQASGLRPGDEVLTTNHEHPGGQVGWEYICARTGAKLVKIDLDAQHISHDEMVAKFAAHLTARTRAISVAHVLFSSGYRMPIRRLSALAHAHGALMVVDGAQVPGMLAVNVKALGCDCYASSSHKWLLAPKGSGLLYIRRAQQAALRPLLLAGGFGAYTAETGTRNFPSMIGHGAAIDWIQLIGKEIVEARVKQLNAYCRSRLAEFKSIKLLRMHDPDIDSGMLAFDLTDRKNRALATALRKKSIIIKVVPRWNAIRISTHIYNNEQDIDRLVEAMHSEKIK